jgi:hypothetical protein
MCFTLSNVKYSIEQKLDLLPIDLPVSQMEYLYVHLPEC